MYKLSAPNAARIRASVDRLGAHASDSKRLRLLRGTRACEETLSWLLPCRSRMARSVGPSRNAGSLRLSSVFEGAHRGSSIKAKGSLAWHLRQVPETGTHWTSPQELQRITVMMASW